MISSASAVSMAAPICGGWCAMHSEANSIDAAISVVAVVPLDADRRQPTTSSTLLGRVTRLTVALVLHGGLLLLCAPSNPPDEVNVPPAILVTIVPQPLFDPTPAEPPLIDAPPKTVFPASSMPSPVKPRRRILSRPTEPAPTEQVYTDAPVSAPATAFSTQPPNPGPAPAADSPPSIAMPEPVREGATVDPSISCRLPDYPAQSRRLHEVGTVQLRLLVAENGAVLESIVETSSGYARLDEAARSALSLCHFKPGTLDGKPERAWALLQYNWRLE